MIADVFLTPCDAGNFEQTVLSTVDLSEYPNRPKELSEMDTVRLWGAREGSRNEDYFERMDSDDLILFYQSGRYVGAGRVGITFKDDNEWTSKTFWNDAPSRLIYTVTGFTPISVPKEAVNQIFDYDDEYTPQGLIRVAQRRVDTQPTVITRALEKYTTKHA